jgi:hypothetical protein
MMMRRRNTTNTPSSRIGRSQSLRFWLLLLVGVVSYSATNAAYIVTIPPKDEECFFVTAPKSAGIFYGNYDMIDSADAVSVIILDANKNQRILYRSRRGATEGNFKVQITAGQKLNVCVQNGIWSQGKRKTPQNRPHDGEDRTVGLQFSFEEKNPHLELHSQSGKLVSATRSLIREMRRLQDHYGYMRAREATHRETVEGTFSQLMSWTLLQGAAVILVAAGQIMYFRRFFEQRRYI